MLRSWQHSLTSAFARREEESCEQLCSIGGDCAIRDLPHTTAAAPWQQVGNFPGWGGVSTMGVCSHSTSVGRFPSTLHHVLLPQETGRDRRLGTKRMWR